MTVVNSRKETILLAKAKREKLKKKWKIEKQEKVYLFVSLSLGIEIKAKRINQTAKREGDYLQRCLHHHHI